MFDYRRVTILWEKYDGQTIPIFRPTHCGLVLVLVFLLIIVVILDLRSDQLTTMVHLTVSWSCMATAWRSENTMRWDTTIFIVGFLKWKNAATSSRISPFPQSLLQPNFTPRPLASPLPFSISAHRCFALWCLALFNHFGCLCTLINKHQPVRRSGGDKDVPFPGTSAIERTLASAAASLEVGVGDED